MFTRLSLRLRVFLFFCLLAAGGTALAAGTLMFGWSRAQGDMVTGPFITAFVSFVFLNTALLLGVWLLFDEHVAKPINRLSAELRLRAHSGVDGPVNLDSARYLGDLAPAVSAMSQTVSTSTLDTAAKIAKETEHLRAQQERLTALLTEMPIATILLNPAQEIVLYDAQAADILSQTAPPRLKAPLADYFDLTAMSEVLAGLTDTGIEVPFKLFGFEGGKDFDARLKALSNDGHIVFIEPQSLGSPAIASRALTFDFDLIETSKIKEIKDTPLSDLCFVPFDTETTGLSVEKDAIVQIGAVRVLNNRMVEAEVINTFVDPGCPIPPGSTKIHGVSDADVAGAPDIATAGRVFHHFARDSVLVAHNAPFDIGLMRRFQADMGVEWNHPVLDTVLLSAVVFGVTEEHSLDVLCDRLSVTIPPHLRHTAFGDAKATGEALIRLLPLLEGKGIGTFGKLIEETQKHGRLLRDLNG